jgi:hypothetical protein
MTRTFVKFAAAAVLVGFISPAGAHTGLETLGVSAIDSGSTASADDAGLTVARRGRGADDPAGDDRGRRRGGRGADDPAGHARVETPNLLIEMARRGRGADDAAGDDRGGRGRGSDDPVGHG